jgi:BirA family biotin operon repressor/biotin-[acetyl-CoA-carboxylase] ligase
MENDQQITEIKFDDIDSTHTYAKQYAETNEIKKWIVITANSQSAGLGQGNKTWYSPPNGNVYCTFIIPFDSTDGFKILPYLTLLSTVTTSQVLEELGFKTGIKWVNDVSINSKKVSGCLVETSIEGDSILAFIGIGINVNMQKEELDTSVTQTATALNLETGKEYDKNLIFASLKSKMYNNITAFENKGKSDFIKYYDDRLLYKDEMVKVIDKVGKEVKTGKFLGIDENGFAQLMDNNKTEIISDGRMSKLDDN